MGTEQRDGSHIQSIYVIVLSEPYKQMDLGLALAIFAPKSHKTYANFSQIKTHRAFKVVLH